MLVSIIALHRQKQINKLTRRLKIHKSFPSLQSDFVEFHTKPEKKMKLTISLNMHIAIERHAGTIVVDALWQCLAVFSVNHFLCFVYSSFTPLKLSNSFNFLRLFHATSCLGHLLLSVDVRAIEIRE